MLVLLTFVATALFYCVVENILLCVARKICILVYRVVKNLQDVCYRRLTKHGLYTVSLQHLRTYLFYAINSWPLVKKLALVNKVLHAGLANF